MDRVRNPSQGSFAGSKGHLLGSVTAAALFLPLAASVPAEAACTPVGTDYTCTGNLSAGVSLTYTSFVTLTVNSLTNNITPASGVDGLRFYSTTRSISLNSDPGSFVISTTGANADGIDARTTGFYNNVTVTNSGNITSAAGSGINTRSTLGRVIVTNGGTINSQGTGIAATGYLTLSNTGAITSTASFGISAATAYSGNVHSIYNSGAIKSALGGIRVSATSRNNSVTNRAVIETTGGTSTNSDAIFVTTSGGNTVDSIGALTSAKGRGIYARGSASQSTITNVGAISARYAGIQVVNAFTITTTGNITSSASYGILASTSYTLPSSINSNGDISAVLGGIKAASAVGSNVTVTSKGNIAVTGGVAASGTGAAINATATNGGTVSVTSTGDLTSAKFRGISAGNGTYGGVLVTSKGKITAQTEGIRAVGAGVAVDSAGDISSATSYGISANSSTAPPATFKSVGNITSALSGVRVIGGSSGFVSVSSKGNIETTGGTATNAHGIYSRSTSGSTSVDSTGDITSANARGIYARASGSATVTSAGYLKTLNEGIRATGLSFTVTSTGTVTSAASYGILGSATASGYIKSTGNTTSALSGIRATTASGTAKVVSKGDIHTSGGTAKTGSGIYANSTASAVDIKSTGNITTAAARGIYAVASGNSKVVSSGKLDALKEAILAKGQSFNVTSAGDVTSTSYYGLSAIGSGAGVSNGLSSTGVVTSLLGGIRATSSSTGAVTVTNNGSITTTGGTAANASGVYAKSAGGAVTVDSVGTISSAKSSGISASAGAGSVSITNSGGIAAQTDGIRAAGASFVIDSAGDIGSAASYGIIASGTGSSTSSISNAGAVTSLLGGIRATGTSSGAVTITNGGDIAATGGSAANGDALYADSAGGAVSIVNTGTATSAAGSAIAARSTVGKITVQNGASLQALAGKGIDAAGGAAVNVTNDGDIVAASNGIRAAGQQVSVLQSQGAVVSTAQSAILVAGSETATVDVRGLVQGASGHAAVAFEDGIANALDIRSTATVENAGGMGQFAVLGGSGNESVTNSGQLRGSVDLGAGHNGLENLAGGLFAMGETVNLGSGNVFRNAGTMSPGGVGTISTVDMTGDITQESGGTWLVDIDALAETADLIELAGRATLSGDVVINASAPLPTSKTYILLHAEDGVTHDGLTLVGAPPSTLAKSFGLVYPDAYTVALGISVDFAPHGIGLNDNQTQLGDYLTDAFRKGPSGIDPVTDALLGMTDPGAYKHALNQLLPEPYLHAAMAGVLASENFAEALLGCPRATQGSADANNCVWAEAGGSYLARSASHEYLEATETAQRIGGGSESRVAPDLRIGVGARYEQVAQEVYSNASTDGYRGQLGVAAIYDPGPLTLTAALSGGHAWLDTERSFAFNGFRGTASGDNDVDLLHGKLRATYQFGTDAAYLTPGLDLDASHVRLGNVTESGGNGAALEVEGGAETLLSVTPHVEIGGQWTSAGGMVVRPFLAGGATYYGDPGFATQSQFRDAPAGVADFTTRETLDSLLWDVSAGLDIYGSDGSSLRVYYDGSFGETTNAQGGGLRANVLF